MRTKFMSSVAIAHADCRLEMWTKQMASPHNALPLTVPFRNNMSRRQPATDERVVSVAQNVCACSPLLVNFFPSTMRALASFRKDPSVGCNPILPHMRIINSDTAIRTPLLIMDFLKEASRSFRPQSTGNGWRKPGAGVGDFRGGRPDAIMSNNSMWNTDRSHKYFNMLCCVSLLSPCLTRAAAMCMLCLCEASGPWAQCTLKPPADTTWSTQCWWFRHMVLWEYMPYPPTARSSSVSSVSLFGVFRLLWTLIVFSMLTTISKSYLSMYQMSYVVTILLVIKFIVSSQVQRLVTFATRNEIY